MKRFLFLFILLGICMISCDREEKELAELQVQFSIGAQPHSENSAGRRTSVVQPKSVIVTIVDDGGNTIVDRQEIPLSKFGDSFLSAPITLKTRNYSIYELSEFLVKDNDNVVRYVAPKEGSENARLVSDPLNIQFSVFENSIATVTPEVLEVEEDENPSKYGYGQFGFKVIKKISAVFSSFIKGASNFELTSSHLKIEGMSGEQVVWTFETDLEAKANITPLREASKYRITATKQGYKPWEKTAAISDNDKIEILFDKASDWDLDIQWSKNFGGSRPDVLKYTLATKDGGALVVTNSWSTDHDVPNWITGQSDAWIFKLTPTGTIEWSLKYGSFPHDTGTSATEFADGTGFLVTGYSSEANYSINHGWVIKISNGGITSWEKHTGQTVFFASTSSLSDPNNFILAGDLGLNNQDVVSEFDGTGNMLWQRHLKEDMGGTIKISKARNSYMLSSPNGLLKMTREGVDWFVNNEGGDKTVISSIYEETDGGYFVVGTDSFNDGIIGNATDIIVGKLDQNGQFYWKKSIRSPFNLERIFDVFQTAPGKYALVGGIIDYNSNNITHQNACIMEINNDGEVLGQRLFRGVDNSWPTFKSVFEFIVPSGNGYIITGSSSGSGGDVPAQHDSYDIWAMRVSLK